MFRRACVARLRPEKKEQYISLHENAWPEVLAELAKHHHHHHSVFIIGDMLFQYFEYTGDDFEEDMRLMRQNPVMQEWWHICAECVWPNSEGRESWEIINEIFHND